MKTMNQNKEVGGLPASRNTLLHFDTTWTDASELSTAICAGNEAGALLEWGDDPRGLFEILAAANRAQRTVLPGRWLPVRPVSRGGVGDSDRLFWVARSDASLRRLLAEDELNPGTLRSTARPDEPLAVLGVPGDVVSSAAAGDAQELRRRAELWLHRLGVDRVALAIAHDAAPSHPLELLARKRGIPVLRIVDARRATADNRSTQQSSASATQSPLLWTDFQLDGEHRLPDESYVPGLRDLLHRGSLMRERSLYERLPEAWRLQADAELRALYSWHVNPLLRRVTALLQTLQPVSGVRVGAPFAELPGVCAYLLGLSDLKPQGDPMRRDAVADARALALALQEWDRRIDADVDASSWAQLRARLATWAEGGHLAACRDSDDQAERVFCFSGQPLWLRTPLRRDVDGMPLTPLSAADRRALGWFELVLRQSAASTANIGHDGNFSNVRAFPFAAVSSQEQLPLNLEGTGA